jgi:hypothetical protein
VLSGFTIQNVGGGVPSTAGNAIAITNSRDVLLANIGFEFMWNGVLIDGSSDVVCKSCSYVPLDVGTSQGSRYGFKVENSSGQGGARCSFLLCLVNETNNGNRNQTVGFYVTKGYQDVSLETCGVIQGFTSVLVTSEGGRADFRVNVRST